MDRREAIKRTALLLGGVVFAPTAAGVLSGCRARPGLEWTPEFFSEEEARLVTALSEVIIPETDTPGAREAGVPAFIEEMVFTAYDEEARERFMEGLEAFNERASEAHGSDYVELEPEAQYAFAEEENAKAIEGEGEAAGTPFFLIMKELTMMGYFTSEVGATQHLQHEPVPGRYDGCAPLEEVGKTWAV